MAQNIHKTCDHVLLICSTCRGSDGALKLRDCLAENLPQGFAIRAVDCMAACDHGGAVGLQGSGKASYLFGSIDSQVDIAAIIEFAHQYHKTAHGWTCAHERPMALYHKTLARLPALKDYALS